jgi:hypothetical protein
MKRASLISSQTGKFSKLFDDELEEFIKFYHQTYPFNLLTNPYFVRTENVSLKY